MTILILSDPNFEDEYAHDYRGKLSESLSSAGHLVETLLGGPLFFLKAIPLWRKADMVFVPNFPSLSRSVLILHKLFKRKVIVKVVGDYAWESAIRGGKTFLLISDFQKSERPGAVGTLHNLQVKLCKIASSVIVESEFLAETVQNWGIERSKIRVICGGLNFSLPVTSKEEARKKIGIPGILLVSTGRLVPWRGFRMLIKIMPQLLGINQFFRLVIAGSGPDYKVLKSMVNNLGLEKKVYLIDSMKKEELARYLTAADIFILNTSYEGFPYYVLEAMSAGVPVVTAASCANTELINQGENGFLVKYNDEFNLVEAVKTIWRTPELRDHFVEEGKKTAAGFTLDKTAEETTKILNS